MENLLRALRMLWGGGVALHWLSGCVASSRLHPLLLLHAKGNLVAEGERQWPTYHH